MMWAEEGLACPVPMCVCEESVLLAIPVMCRGVPLMWVEEGLACPVPF